MIAAHKKSWPSIGNRAIYSRRAQGATLFGLLGTEAREGSGGCKRPQFSVLPSGVLAWIVAWKVPI